MTQEDTVRLRHMLDAARSAVAYASGRVREDLDQNQMLALAVTRLLEILGEAAKQVSAPVRNSHPTVQWKQISGMRDRLIHAYFNVDFDIVWEVVTVDLPDLIPVLESLLVAVP